MPVPRHSFGALRLVLIAPFSYAAVAFSPEPRRAAPVPTHITRSGLDHRVGYLVSMATEKTPASLQRGIATRELPRHP